MTDPSWTRRLLMGAAIAAILVAGCGDGTRSPESERVVAQPVMPSPSDARPAPKATTGPSATSASAVEDEGDAPQGSGGDSGAFSTSDRESFAALERQLGGSIGVAVVGSGRRGHVSNLGALRSGVAWSTSKLPIAMAIIDAGQATAQRSSLSAAITESDNAAAARLWDALGGGDTAARAATAELRAAGDERTIMESRQLRSEFSSFGQTVWGLSDQARFAAGMVCTSSGTQVLELMGQVVSGQRWGLGSAGVQAQFKGGWGPGIRPGENSGYFDRQVGVLNIRGRPLAVAIAAAPTDGSHETATGELTTIAQWVTSRVSVSALPRRPRCG